ncbi:MAG: Na+/H+ antiporter NhaA [Gammaproteobacteria bacterium]|nr:Na+/H+ antiporter NhaA [Gammaproteobacteria bacterium]MCW5582340.1 Na+/H+ antiporter NhaA [Gammaproteobacteria bacterium]
MAVRLLKQFLQLESSSGILLFFMAILSLILANSPIASLHQQFTHRFLFIVNDGLMTLFFLIVGLELKRAYIDGQLSRLSQVALPFIAALGGMIVPALIYYWINYADSMALKGWATPIATDIAFALGVLSLLGWRVPAALKLFLLALAIFDDIGAIIIIALFYSHGFSVLYLCFSAAMVFMLVLFHYYSIQSLFPYLLIGVLLWCCLLHSGIHPTIGGVFVALTIPDKAHESHSPLNKLENALHPWVAYVIMPLFALTNAGFSLSAITWDNLTDKMVLGIALGLFIGKQVGVFLFSWLVIQLGFAKLPEKSTWLQLYGTAVLCGIGFTMSLFLGTLSFASENIYLAEVRLGVIMGSLLSSLVGAIVLLFAFYKTLFFTKHGKHPMKELHR